MNAELRIAVNTGCRYAAQIATMAVGFFLTPYLVGKLGAKMLGLQVLSADVLQFSLLFNSAISVGYSRYAMFSYAKGDYAKMNLLLGRGLVVTALLAIPSILMVVLAAVFANIFFGLTEDVLWYGRAVILITGTVTILGLLTSVWNSATFMTERFYIESIGRIISSILAAIGVITLFYLMQPSIIVWVSLSSGMGLIITWFVTIPWSMRGLPQMKIVPHFGKIEESRSMLNLSMASFFGGLSYLLYYATDSIIISNLDGLGPAKIFAYSVGQRWDPVIRGILVAFVTALQPAMIAFLAAKNHDAVRRVLYRSTRYCMLMGMLPCIILFAFSDPFVRCWVGDAFVSESGPVLRWVMIGLVFSIPTISGYEVLVALAKVREAVVASFIGGIVNIVLSIVLARYAGLGILGVALGTMISLTVKNSVYMPWLISSKLEINLYEYTKATYVRPFFCAMPLILSVALLRYWPEPTDWPLLLAQMAACTIIYGISMWLIGLTGEDRMKTMLAFNKILVMTRVRSQL